MEIGGIILAGGQSKRFGKNKCMLTLNNHTLLQIVADTLMAICKEVVVIAKESKPYILSGFPVIVEKDKRQLSLIGLLTGLRSSKYEKNLVVACDMPFINPVSLKILINNSFGYDAVLPVIDGKKEPLHALYSKSCISLIEKSLANGETRLTSFLDGLKVNYLKNNLFESHDSKLLSFYNINTKEDFKKAQRIERSSKR